MCPSEASSVHLSSIPAGVSYITNKSCLVCIESEKYAFWFTPRTPYPRVQGAHRIALGGQAQSSSNSEILPIEVVKYDSPL